MYVLFCKMHISELWYSLDALIPFPSVGKGVAAFGSRGTKCSFVSLNVAVRLFSAVSRASARSHQ